jgi:hypothetical protein
VKQHAWKREFLATVWSQTPVVQIVSNPLLKYLWGLVAKNKKQKTKKKTTKKKQIGGRVVDTPESYFGGPGF